MILGQGRPSVAFSAWRLVNATFIKMSFLRVMNSFHFCVYVCVYLLLREHARARMCICMCVCFCMYICMWVCVYLCIAHLLSLSPSLHSYTFALLHSLPFPTTSLSHHLYRCHQCCLWFLHIPHLSLSLSLSLSLHFHFSRPIIASSSTIGRI